MSAARTLAPGEAHELVQRSATSWTGSSSARSGCSSGSSSPCSPTATACSKACPASARRSPSRRWPRRLAAPFTRIQFTPDLIPSDIVGTRIYRPSTERFDVELGPIFANFMLADEINRAPAKVQSALLEVMAERQVSIGGTTYPAASAVPRAGHPEPDRVRGRLPPARGAARPLPDAHPRRLPDAGRGARDRRPEPPGAARPAQVLALDDVVALQAATDAVYVDPARRLRREPRARHPAPRRARAGPSSTATSPTAPAPGPASGSSGRPAPWRCSRAATYAVPQDVYDIAYDVLNHRLVLSFDAIALASPSTTCWSTS